MLEKFVGHCYAHLVKDELKQNINQNCLCPYIYGQISIFSYYPHLQLKNQTDTHK